MGKDCGCGCGGLHSDSTARCFTRALKNEQYLRQNAPHLFDREEGHGLPSNTLRLLHRLCHDSPLLKDHPTIANFLKTDQLPLPKLAPASTLFSGTIYFAQVNFTIGSAPTPLKVSDGDMKTIVQYAQLAATPISAYCNQYGAAKFSISSQILTYSVNIPTGSLTDGQIQGWVNDIQQLNSLADDSTIFIPCPNGISGGLLLKMAATILKRIFRISLAVPGQAIIHPLLSLSTMSRLYMQCSSVTRSLKPLST